MQADDSEYERNNASYGRLKEAISQTYPRGWFVGIADDQVVGGAEDFRSLQSILHANGKDPRRVLIVQAGVDYPEYATILSESDNEAHYAHSVDYSPIIR